MTAWLRRFGAFWYDFVVGDDWRVAAGVAGALVVTSALSAWTSRPTWWVVPAAVVVLLVLSVRRAIPSGELVPLRRVIARRRSNDS